MRTSSLLRHLITATALLLALVTIAPAAATAGTATIYSCRNPDGSGNAAAGWVTNFPSYYTVSNNCSVGGSLHLATDASAVPVGNGATWDFYAPADTAITRIDSYDRETSAFGGGAFARQLIWFDLSSSAQVFESCIPIADGNECNNHGNLARASVPIGDIAPTTHLQLHEYCTTQGASDHCDTAGSNPSADIYQTVVRLSDTTPPAVTGASGSLYSDQVLHGSEALSVTASDQGLGAFAIDYLVDGALAYSAPWSSQPSCRSLAQAPTRYAFSSPTPCPTGRDTVNLNLDSTSIADGTHTLTVQLVDAAGNATQIFSRTVTVDNKPPAIGPVSIAGTPYVGETLTCSAPVDGQAASVTYQWSRLDPSKGQASDTPVPEATGSSYTLATADDGKKLLCAVTATDLGGSSTAKTTNTTAPFSGDTLVQAPGVPGRSASSCPATTTQRGGIGANGDWDGDGIPNCRDTDDDNDGIPDRDDVEPFSPMTGAQAAANVPAARVVAAFTASKRATATVNYRTVPVITGTVLSAAGTPIPGAALDVLTRSQIRGAKTIKQSGLRTTPKGTFTLRLPRAGTSRTVQLRYAAGGASTVANLVLNVRAQLVMHVKQVFTRSRAGTRSWLVFTGSLKGTAFPRYRPLVEMQVQRSAVQWLGLGDTKRVDRRGRFVIRHPLSSNVRKNTRFFFRAVIQKTADYPYAAAVSKAKVLAPR